MLFPDWVDGLEFGTEYTVMIREPEISRERFFGTLGTGSGFLCSVPQGILLFYEI